MIDVSAGFWEEKRSETGGLNGVRLMDLVSKIGAFSQKPTASAVGRKVLKL
jgi:hypothetical protein